MQKNAVIYARYSSEKQNEQSIAGQVAECTNWAKKNDINIIATYSDEALTGKTDKRPSFQRMISDAKSGKFDTILVYKLDRFARNRYDSAIYKAQLKKHNVRVLSVMENIAEGPEGIILESVLEGMAEYYSANLAQNVIRGLRQRAEQAKYLGGAIPYGLAIDADKNFIIDESKSQIVKKIFDMYSNGDTIKEIISYLKNSGHKTNQGKDFTYNIIRTMLSNTKYIGKYEYMGISIDNAIPRIIDDATFDTVKRKLEHNKHSPASSKSPVTFFLTGKLFCGKCGSNMVGDSGTGRRGTTYYYYSCIEKKRKHGCTKKTVKKDYIEELVCDITVNQVLTDANIEMIAKKAFELSEKERIDTSELDSLKKSLKDTQKTIDNIMSAIEQGIITPTTKERLLEAEERKELLTAAIAREEIQKPTINYDSIVFYLHDIRSKIFNSPDRKETILNAFVNSVYLYDDKISITFNLQDGIKTKKFETSELERFGFNDVSCTITILSEPLLFVVTKKLRTN